MHKKKILEIRNQKSTVVPTLTDWDRVFMAYHEAGHAVCSHYLPEREPLMCITIDPSCEAFGMVRTTLRQHHNETIVSFSSTIATFLAGGLSEEIFLNTKTTSCIYDLEAAQQLATDMVLKFGMGDSLGPSVLSLLDHAMLSESYKKSLCEDIQKIMMEADSNARNILNAHKSTVEKLADKLLLKKTLKYNEINDFFGGKNI